MSLDDDIKKYFDDDSDDDLSFSSNNLDPQYSKNVSSIAGTVEEGFFSLEMFKKTSDEYYEQVAKSRGVDVSKNAQRIQEFLNNSTTRLLNELVASSDFKRSSKGMKQISGNTSNQTPRQIIERIIGPVELEKRLSNTTIKADTFESLSQILSEEELTEYFKEKENIVNK